MCVPLYFYDPVEYISSNARLYGGSDGVRALETIDAAIADVNEWQLPAQKRSPVLHGQRDPVRHGLAESGGISQSEAHSFEILTQERGGVCRYKAVIPAATQQNLHTHVV
jgi:hypothetical protein